MKETNRTRPVQKIFWLTPEENDLIKRKMDQANMSNFSAFVRYMLTAGEIRVIDFEAVKDLRLAINRVGHNINQIAKQVNTNDEVSYQELVSILSLLGEINDNLNTHLEDFDNQMR